MALCPAGLPKLKGDVETVPEARVVSLGASAKPKACGILGSRYFNRQDGAGAERRWVVLDNRNLVVSFPCRQRFRWYAFVLRSAMPCYKLLARKISNNNLACRENQNE